MAKLVERDGVVEVLNDQDVTVSRLTPDVYSRTIQVPASPSKTAADNTTAIINAISAAQAGTQVILPPGVLKVVAGQIEGCLTDKEMVFLQGAGADLYTYSRPTEGTVLKADSGSGAILTWVAQSTSVGLRGTGMDGIAFDMNAVASIGVDLASHYGFRCPAIRVDGSSALAGHVGIKLRTVDLSGVEDFQGAHFGQVVVAMTNGKCMTWSSWQATGGNVSLCRFENMILYVNNAGTCLEAGDSDHNTVGMLELNRSGTATGLDLLGTSADPYTGHARGNYFHMIDGPAPIIARATGYTTPSADNYVRIQVGGNSQPFPTVEPGATLTVESVT